MKTRLHDDDDDDVDFLHYVHTRAIVICERSGVAIPMSRREAATPRDSECFPRQRVHSATEEVAFRATAGYAHSATADYRSSGCRLPRDSGWHL